MNKAFFLDRDGTINKDVHYLDAPEKVELIPGAADAIKLMNEAGYKVIVVSNQSGVARGYFKEEVVDKINARINELLNEHNAHIDAFYWCPHYIGGKIKKYAIDCECRKPKLGLFKQGIIDFDLEPRRCYACGDKSTDIENLEKLGLPKSHLKKVQCDEEYGLMRVFDWKEIKSGKIKTCIC